MLNLFMQVHDMFQTYGVDDPLVETLNLFDLISGSALRKIDLSMIEKGKIDFAQIAKKRKKGEPYEYIFKMANFMGLSFHCTPDTLIPREETELLANTAINLIEERQETKNKITVVDVGTGCGNICISIAINTENTKILASDISAKAIDIAKMNVNKFHLQDRVILFCGDLLSPINKIEYRGEIDIIVCNPPYIPTKSLDNLPAEVIGYEPKVALDAGPFGIDIYRRLIKESLPILKPNGALIFEIGVGQDKLVNRLIEKSNGYTDIELIDDGINIRVVKAIKK